MNLVSVIIASYNRFYYLLNAIKSIQEQTYKNIEIIVINDGSFQKEYTEYKFADNVTVLHREVNSRSEFGYANLGHIRNQGIKIAKGEYVAILDDDDYWLPTKIEKQLDEMKKNNCWFSCTKAFIDTVDGGGIYNITKKYVPIYNYNHAMKLHFDIEINLKVGDIFFIKKELCNKKFNSIICSSVLVKKDLLKKINWMDTDKPPAEDERTWIKLLKITNCVLINIPLLYYDVGHGDGHHWI
jgi:glycosyltransferase involved in cell wall biosynthesis